jgi:hypothetical protein
MIPSSLGSISAAGSRGQLALELLEEFFARPGDGFGPEVSFPVTMERGLWGECHSGAGASAENDWRLFSFPAIGAAVRALVGSLVKVLGVLPDLDDHRQRNLIKAPIRVAVHFAVRVRVTDHFLECECIPPPWEGKNSVQEGQLGAIGSQT